MRLVLMAITVSCLFVSCSGDDGPVEATVASSTTAAPLSTSSVPPTSSDTAPRTTKPPKPKAKPTLTSRSSLSTVGLDRVTFGMTVKQAERAARTEMVPESTPNSDCYWVKPAKAPKGIRFMVSEGTIERVDIVTGPITTRSGVGIGTPVDRVVELFGDQIGPSDDGRSLVFVPSDESDAQFRVIFETDGEVVTSLRSGRVPQVRSTDCAG